MATESRRIPIACATCGARYQVRESRAHAALACRACGDELEVTGRARRKSSLRVLVSAGIDPVAAERRFEEESARAYRCTRCGREALRPEQVTYAQGELLCGACSSPKDDEPDARAARREARQRRLSRAALGAAAAHAALFFAGFAGPLHVVTGASLATAACVGAIVALVGGALVLGARRPPTESVKAA